MRTAPEPRYEYDINRLVYAYKEAIRKLLDELERFDPSDMRAANIRVLLADIAQTLKKLSEEAAAWVDEVVPKAAQEGVAATLVELGIVKTVAEAEKFVSFNRVNQHAVAAAIADLQNDLLAVTRNVERRTRSAVRQAVAEAMRENMARGVNAPRTIRREVLRDLRRRLGQSIETGIIDAAGRRWRPEVYVDMVVRTKLMDVYIEAKRNEALSRGAYYGIISSHGAKDACRFHEGRIVKLLPSAPGYYPTIEQLRATNQIFHPNCKHTINIINDPLDLPPDVLQKARKQEEIGEQAIATGKRNPSDSLVRRTKARERTIEEIERSFRMGTDAHLRAIQAQAKRKVEAFTGKRKPLEVKVWERIAKGVNSEKDLRDIGKMIDDAITDTAKRVRARRDKLLKERDKWDEAAEKYHVQGKYKERDKALAKSEELTRKALELNKEIVKLEAKKGEAYLEFLSKIRPFGPGKNKQQWHPLSNDEIVKTIEAAFKYLPRDWVELSAQTQLYAEEARRGFFREARDRAPSTIALRPGDVQTALHELGHRMEWMRAAISEMESEFYRRRTNNLQEPLRWLGGYYRKDEVARFDKFTNPYMGKWYGDGFFEILTMGLEGVFFGAHELQRDKDMLYFILGILAAL